MLASRPPLVLLFVLLLAASFSGARGDEAPQPPRLVVPVGLPIQLDGRIVDAEWEGAEEIELAKDGSTLRIMQRRGTLFLGLTSPAPWADASSVWFCFTPDDEKAGLYAKGAVRLDFEPREHNRPHLLVVRRDGPGDQPVPGVAFARSEVTGPFRSVEIALRLELIGVNADDATPVRFALIWMRGARSPAVTWPAHIRTSAPIGRRPPDLQSSATWARLTGWKNADGPGAISKTDWERVRTETEELTRRGAQAHALGLTIQDAPSHPKQDANVQAQVFDNFRWIAEKEALTPYDLSVLARIHRHLNQKKAGLALLDSLQTHPAWRTSSRLLYDRALALESAERYPQAASQWRKLAGRSQPALKARYETMADRADGLAVAWETEQRLRKESAARPDLPLVLVRTTRGNFLIQLFPEQVPEGVRHFLDLVERSKAGVYANTRFHRVEGDFLVQGGDPISREDLARAGSGTGPTSVTAELNPEYGYFRGAVAFARSIARVNGSQFFILVSPRPALQEEGYTVFGHVLAGMDVVDRIEYGDELIEVRRIECAPGELPETKKEEEMK